MIAPIRQRTLLANNAKQKVCVDTDTGFLCGSLPNNFPESVYIHEFTYLSWRSLCRFSCGAGGVCCSWIEKQTERVDACRFSNRRSVSVLSFFGLINSHPFVSTISARVIAVVVWLHVGRYCVFFWQPLYAGANQQ